ncbi:MAG: DUF507 family protein [Epsilonproteobacteria bacterium]|nr:DUF507 family protein [Campylobacterota bacterium]
MKIGKPHAPYIANKIAIDLLNSSFITMSSGVEPVAKAAKDIIEVDIQKELALEERVYEIMEENADEMEFMQVDQRNMFWLIKKRLANEYGVILSYEDRYSDLSHKILDNLIQNDLIEFNVSENMVKNIIFSSIESYLEKFEEIEDRVIEKIKNYKRKLIPGSEEYDIVFEKLYQEELKKIGMM